MLGKEFAADFTMLLVSGEDPMKHPLPAPPTMRSFNEFLGKRAKQKACEKYRRNPGIDKAISGAIGLPPKLTDAGSVAGPTNESQQTPN
jgi:hypothetical protein